jgi:hypothetical protein
MAAQQGLQKLARGGLEEGGVLWGTLAGGRLSIAAMRPIECEHARGPAFLLSDVDRERLRAALAHPDAELRGLKPLGWWVSHTRSEIRLNPGDLEIFNEFFPAPLQATLVVKPALHQPSRAGWFLRDTLGAVEGARSLEEFDLRIRGRGVFGPAPERTPVVIPRREHPPDPPLVWEALAEPAPPPAPVVPAIPPRAPVRRPEPVELPKFLTAQPEPPAPWKRFLWVALLVAALLGGSGYAGVAYWRWRYPEALGLQVVERDAQLQIQWDRNSSLVRSARGGAVQIRDGEQVKTLALEPGQLRSGSLTYARRTGDVEIKLTVDLEEGRVRQESTRFLGQPPAPELELERLRNRVRELERLRR